MAQFQTQVKKIGVFTSGGDAPGMNAAIRAVVRAGISQNLEVAGIIAGYTGMLESNIIPLNLRSVANLIQKGGTFLKTARCPEFHKAEFRTKAATILKKNQIDGLVCIGGDGSFAGAQLLWKEHRIPIIGIPGTIDNDIWGSDNTIGFDTAVNTALDAIDKIRDTAASHDRLFIVEVMGKNSGFIATYVGLAGGAEEIFVPDYAQNIDKTIDRIKDGVKKGKTSSILITAEGQKPGRAYDLADAIRKKSGFDAKVCILGHIQRGGSPTALDRVIASRMGAEAVRLLMNQQCDLMVGTQGEKLVHVPLEQAIQTEKNSNRELVDLAHILAI